MAIANVIINNKIKIIIMKKILANLLCLIIPNRRMRHKIRRYVKLHSQKIKNNKYDCIFSMGSACFVATSLDISKLRLFSGPFDWMYNSTFEKRFDVFLKKFAHYFDKKDMKYLEPAKKCDAYMNKRTDLIYNHDFLAGSNFDTEYPKVAEKYKRRTDRVLDKIATGHRALIVYAERVIDKETSNKTKLINLVNQANKIYGDKIDLLYLKSVKNKKDVTIEQVNDHLWLAKYSGYIYLENDEDSIKALHKCLRIVCKK